MQNLPPSFRPSRHAGFSLVEVVIALGICSFGLVTTLGLLPVGLTTARRAMDLTAQTQVIRQVTGMLGQVHYRDLRSMDRTVYYFDDQGIQLTGNDIPKAVFTATLQVPAGADPAYPAPTSFPSGTAISGVPSQRLATIGVLIATHGAAQNSVNLPIYVADRGW